MAQSCLTVGPWTAAHQASLFFTTSWSLLKLNVHWVSDATQPSQPVTPFSSCPQFFPASGSFPTSQLFESGGQRSGVSASASVFPVNIQDWFPSGLIFLQSMGLSRVFSSTTVQQHQFFSIQPSLWSNSHTHTWLLGKNLALTVWTFVSKVMSLLFNLLSRFVAVFLPRSKRLLVSWLQALSAVILELRKRKSSTVSTCPTSICLEAIRLDMMIFFWMLSF